jgi:hypothetical protein
MRAFAEAYPDKPIVQQAAAHIPLFHNCTLLDKVKAPTESQLCNKLLHKFREIIMYRLSIPSKPQLEALGEALLDLPSVEDLIVWLQQNS